MALAERYIEAFTEDAKSLGLLTPDREPRVSQQIPQIISLIAKLVENGNAYQGEDSVWFDVASCKDYGALSRQKTDELRSADPEPGKRSAADFALWKCAKPGEPAWESPWGLGRPGWHIECSAMAGAELGETIDIHGGGLDLVFPHHENEIAQSECAHGKKYARYWMHNGLLTMTSGKKMGKSLGNVRNIRDVLVEFPAEVLRLYYLRNQYRSPLPWNEEVLPQTLGMCCRLYEALETAESMQGTGDAQTIAKSFGPEGTDLLMLADSFADKFYQAVDNDFNTAKGIGYLFELARAINRFAGKKKAKSKGAPVVKNALQAFAIAKDALGICSQPVGAFFEEVKDKRLAAQGILVEDVEKLLSDRTKARHEKNWTMADDIRAKLDELSIEVMDRQDGGCDWRVKVPAASE